MPLSPITERRLTAECEQDADGILAALKEMDRADGITPPDNIDRARLLRAIRRRRGLDDTPTTATEN